MLTDSTTAASAGVRPVCTAIHEDEPAFMLAELDLVRPPSHQWHRYQVITVNRDDTLTDWWHDLGPSEQFTAGPIAIPGIWEESVGTLRDLAEDIRLADDTFQKRKAELQAASTLVPDMLRQLEEGKRVIANQTVSGPFVTHQRNGFDRRAFNERIRR